MEFLAFASSQIAISQVLSGSGDSSMIVFVFRENRLPLWSSRHSQTRRVWMKRTRTDPQRGQQTLSNPPQRSATMNRRAVSSLLKTLTASTSVFGFGSSLLSSFAFMPISYSDTGSASSILLPKPRLSWCIHNDLQEVTFFTSCGHRRRDDCRRRSCLHELVQSAAGVARAFVGFLGNVCCQGE